MLPVLRGEESPARQVGIWLNAAVPEQEAGRKDNSFSGSSLWNRRVFMLWLPSGDQIALLALGLRTVYLQLSGGSQASAWGWGCITITLPELAGFQLLGLSPITRSPGGKLTADYCGTLQPFTNQSNRSTHEGTSNCPWEIKWRDRNYEYKISQCKLHQVQDIFFKWQHPRRKSTSKNTLSIRSTLLETGSLLLSHSLTGPLPCLGNHSFGCALFAGLYW